MALDSTFVGKVAVVTGGASGLGRGLCEALASCGAKVVIADLDHAAAQRLATELERSACEAMSCTVDVTDPLSVDALVAQVVARHGRLDYMFNNAGIAAGGEFQDLDAHAMRRVIEVNLLGSAYGTLSAYRQMLRQRGGHIVNIASMYGLIPGPMTVAYVAAKHGLAGLTLSVQSEAKAHGIDLTLVCPGYISTNLFAAGTYASDLNAAQVVERVPFRFIDVRTAVSRTLSAVRRKQRIAVFPAYVRLLWWLQRLSPRLMHLVMHLVMQQQRKRFGEATTRAAKPDA